MNKQFKYMTWISLFSLMMVTPLSFATSLKISDLERMKTIKKELVGKWRCSAHNTEDRAFFEFVDDFHANGRVYSSGLISTEHEGEFSNAKVEIESRWQLRDATHVYYDEIKTLNVESEDVDLKHGLEDLYAERISAIDEILLFNGNERVFREVDENYPNLPPVECVRLAE